MANKNFHTFIDFGKSAIRASSFNKETKKVENQLELTIKDNQSNNLSSEEELIEDLIFNLEKKNGEYLDEISPKIEKKIKRKVSFFVSNKSLKQKSLTIFET